MHMLAIAMYIYFKSLFVIATVKTHLQHVIIIKDWDARLLLCVGASVAVYEAKLNL